MGKTESVTRLLDALPTMDPGSRTQVDPALIQILSVCILRERFHL